MTARVALAVLLDGDLVLAPGDDHRPIDPSHERMAGVDAGVDDGDAHARARRAAERPLARHAVRPVRRDTLFGCRRAGSTRGARCQRSPGPGPAWRHPTVPCRDPTAGLGSRGTVLDPETADPDPIAEFGRWLADAFASGIQNADACAVATAAADGRPSVRFVLCKGADARGFVFYTNTESRKAGELAENAAGGSGLLLERSRASGARDGPRGARVAGTRRRRTSGRGRSARSSAPGHRRRAVPSARGRSSRAS